MKRRILSCLLCFCLLAAGCSAQRTETGERASDATASTAETRLNETTSAAASTEETAMNTAISTSAADSTQAETEAPAGLRENEAFTNLVGACEDAILGVIYNDPFVDGNPVPTVVWNEGEYDRLVIYPRYVGSEVSAWRIVWTGEEGQTRELEGPVYSAVCGQGDCFAAALDRPEGAAGWVVTVTSPDGAEDGLELDYNGRYGTFAYEYLVDDAASPLRREYPELEALYGLETVLGGEELHAFLRATVRERLDPWAAMKRFCSPLADFGDSAAYTCWQGEMDGDTYELQAVRLRENYDPGEGGLAERAAAQARQYAVDGNKGGILGPEAEAGEALYMDLTGLTVYNPTLLAQTVRVTVNGEEVGVFKLTEGDFCTLLELDCTGLPADVPIQVTLHVEQSRGAEGAAILEAWPGIGGNISGAR